MNQLHALVIDDNPQNRKVLVQLLSKQSVTCTEVADPTQLEQTPTTLSHIDVVFLDLEMPGLDGFSVQPLLRKRLVGQNHIAQVFYDFKFNQSIGKPYF